MTKTDKLLKDERVSTKLHETSSGNYLVSVALTFQELTELCRVASEAIITYHKKSRDKSQPTQQRELIGRRTEVLSSAVTHLTEARHVIKKATNARRAGRYLAARVGESEGAE